MQRNRFILHVYNKKSNVNLRTHMEIIIDLEQRRSKPLNDYYPSIYASKGDTINSLNYQLT